MSTTLAPPADQAALPGLDADPVGQLLDWAIAERVSIHLVGPHGIGKTAYVTDLVGRRGLRVVSKSLPVCTQRDFCVPVPVATDDGGRAIDVLVLEELLQRHPDDRYVVILDELSRASEETLNTAMELLQEHTIAGRELPGLVAVVALDNPHDDPNYRGVHALDLAQADRLTALSVTAEQIPWRAHLERTHHVDLTDLARQLQRLDPAHRAVLCPRVIDHLLSVHAAALPLEWALPIHGEGRERLCDRDGRDITLDVLRQLVATLPTPATPASPSDERVVDAIAVGIKNRWNVRLVGAPGIGKTSHIRAAVEAAGMELHYLSLAETSPSDLVVPVPVDGALDFLPARGLVEPGRRYVLVLDEFSRAPVDVAAAAMELVNERSLAGRPLDGCVAVVALDNPPRLGAISFDAGRIDAAQASRFTCTIEVTEDDLPWRDHLVARFGEVAAPFLEWRAEDLEDEVRALVSPRCLERMVSLHLAGLDPVLGLPVLGGRRVPAPTVSLRRRLDGRGGLGLRALVADLPATLGLLRDGDPPTEVAVHAALSRADSTSLDQHASEVRRLFGALPPALRLALVRVGEQRRDRFVRLLADATTGA